MKEESTKINQEQKEEEESPTLFDNSIFWHSDESLSSDEEQEREKIKRNRSQAIREAEEEERELIEKGIVVPEIEYLFKKGRGDANNNNENENENEKNFDFKIRIRQDTRHCCGGKVWDSVSVHPLLLSISFSHKKKNKKKKKGLHDLRLSSSF